MEEIPQILMDIRKEVMISPKGGKPNSKTSHFIKPMLQFPDKIPVLPTVHLAFRPVFLECVFNGWRGETDDQWVSWVDKLVPKFKPLWKKAGIFDAIMASRFCVIKNEELVLGLAERWCCETNTFVFPWGEATLTLEDVSVLGGFSVLGSSVYDYNNDRQVAEIDEQLLTVYDNLRRGVSSKEEEVNQGVWMERFMGTGSEIEHEAFLALWLSRFVFPSFPYNSVVSNCFMIAVCLAKGIEMALAPFVLASIYKDLSLIKSNMKDFAEMGYAADDMLMMGLWAPFQLVQVWAWERFPEFRPKPKKIRIGKPRIARWGGVNEKDIGNVRAVLQSCGDSFVWRPYCKGIDGLPTPGVFTEDEQLVFMGEDVRKDVQVLARCLRVGELVGLESIEQYNPHRVAMQFGFDQDVPLLVKRGLMGYGIQRRELQQLAWLDYSNPVKDQMLYIPSISYVPQVTSRYLEWFRDGVLTRLAALKGIVKGKRGSVRLRRLEPPRLLFDIDEDSSSFSDDDDLGVHSGCDNPPISDVTKKVDVSPASTKFRLKKIADIIDNLQSASGVVPKSIVNDPDVPPRFTPKPTHSGVAKRKPDEIHGFGVKKQAVYAATDGLPGPRGFVPVSLGTNPDVPPGFPPLSSLATWNADAPPGFVPKKTGNHPDVPPGFKPICVTPNKEGLGPEPLVQVKKERFE